MVLQSNITVFLKKMHSHFDKEQVPYFHGVLCNGNNMPANLLHQLLLLCINHYCIVLPVC